MIFNHATKPKRSIRNGENPMQLLLTPQKKVNLVIHSQYNTCPIWKKEKSHHLRRGQLFLQGRYDLELNIISSPSFKKHQQLSFWSMTTFCRRTLHCRGSCVSWHKNSQAASWKLRRFACEHLYYFILYSFLLQCTIILFFWMNVQQLQVQFNLRLTLFFKIMCWM